MLKQGMNTTYAALFVLMPMVASAGQDVSSPYVASSIIQEMGYSHELRPNDYGSSDIFLMVDGFETQIMFLSCKTDRHCDAILFVSEFDDVRRSVTVDSIMAYNEEESWAKAHMDNVGDATLRMPINTYGGISEKTFRQSFKYWEEAMESFGYLLPY